MSENDSSKSASLAEILIRLTAEKGLALNQRQMEQFDLYYRELVEWNEKMNLTGITDRDQVYIKHFYDSLSLAFFEDLSSVETLADIGSGAGFPGIPLKIAFPHLKLTIVDSLNKRIGFLRHLADTLGLEGVTLVHGRAEDIARLTEHRDRYDAVTARAVARLAVLNELCLPFVKVGGWFAAMKGAAVAEETAEAGVSIRELGAELAGTHSFRLPMEDAERYMVMLRKIKSTPKKYPRKAGLPVKQPLL
ncbi:16S rRNA (guanine(527)-N(7))-methyltransferase RsmG [Gorillibacterium sp. sgz500922]|uniref:16S rRNA (guanine(527)-N(7))-methyltransferase RsmG n=1 Tax=Gorillibacterium sp. sgz500922 TaxID=3446694 RepID=UPI003F664E7D